MLTTCSLLQTYLRFKTVIKLVSNALTLTGSSSQTPVYFLILNNSRKIINNDVSVNVRTVELM